MYGTMTGGMYVLVLVQVLVLVLVLVRTRTSPANLPPSKAYRTPKFMPASLSGFGARVWTLILRMRVMPNFHGCTETTSSSWQGMEEDVPMKYSGF
jgi:hypothetical protein